MGTPITKEDAIRRLTDSLGAGPSELDGEPERVDEGWKITIVLHNGTKKLYSIADYGRIALLGYPDPNS